MRRRDGVTGRWNETAGLHVYTVHIDSLVTPDGHAAGQEDARADVAVPAVRHPDRPRTDVTHGRGTRRRTPTPGPKLEDPAPTPGTRAHQVPLPNRGTSVPGPRSKQPATIVLWSLRISFPAGASSPSWTPPGPRHRRLTPSPRVSHVRDRGTGGTPTLDPQTEKGRECGGAPGDVCSYTRGRG